MAVISDATVTDIPIIIDIAEKSWWKAYGTILHANQIRYMLDLLYDPDVLRKEMSTGGQHFLLASSEDGPEAFASYGMRHDAVGVYKIQKIYVAPEKQGKGLGTALIREITQRLSIRGIRTVELNVNRNNPARNFYERLGFSIYRQEDIPIGPYWMNDYVMRKSW